MTVQQSLVVKAELGLGPNSKDQFRTSLLKKITDGLRHSSVRFVLYVITAFFLQPLPYFVTP